MSGLTPRQRQAFEFIKRFISKNGFSPTLDELGQHMGVTKVTARQYVQALQRKGALRADRYAHRSLEPVDKDEGRTNSLTLPLAGRIAAGSPLDAVEDLEMVDVADALDIGRAEGMFLLQVTGDSMVEEGIFDGDYVIVEPSATARNGETVVALLDDGTATLKKFHREKNRVRLQPANSAMKPIYVRGVAVQGIVKGVVRSLARGEG